MSNIGIKVRHAALDETPNGEIILRGVIDPSSLESLLTAEYQREVLSPRKVAALKVAILTSSVPDIELGMRGQRYENGTQEDEICLLDPVYIIDGLQRVTAAKELIREGGNKPPYLGVKVHFDTTESSERELFDNINLGQTRLSSNVTLRNQRENPAIEALYRLSMSDKSFAAYGQVSWKQNMERGTLFTATTMVRIVGRLHSHAGPGRSTNTMQLAGGLETIMDNVGKASFIANVRTFFDVVDRCWGLKRVTYRNTASYVKVQFLLQLARLFSKHTNYWKGDKLVVDQATIAKLRQFPISDQHVISLAGAGGTAGNILYNLMVDHLYKGKRHIKLVPRSGSNDSFLSTEMSNLEEE